jgi:hypothetical protein
MNGSRRVAIVPPNETDAAWHEDAIKHLNRIAIRLDLPIICPPHEDTNNNDSSSDDDVTSYSHILTAVSYSRANSYAIAIHANPPPSPSSKRKKKSRLPKLDPMIVDLVPPSNSRLGYRMSQTDTSGGEELLLKALGLKKMISEKQLHNKGPLVIYDLTAGLARDSLIILNAFLGDDGTAKPPPIRLHMMERDKVVASLVLDAMRRLQLLAQIETANSPERSVGYAKQLLQCLTMEEGDAVTILERLSSSTRIEESPPSPPDVCYLDPMFPPRKKKSSAVKKDMSMLHSLLGTADANDNPLVESDRLDQERKLLEIACKCATRRVVVKRPIGAPVLGCLSDNDCESVCIRPSYDIRGSVNRWDVYVIS